MRAGGGISRQAALPCLCCFVVGGGLIISLPFFFLNFGSTGNGRGEKPRTTVSEVLQQKAQAGLAAHRRQYFRVPKQRFFYSVPHP